MSLNNSVQNGDISSTNSGLKTASQNPASGTAAVSRSFAHGSTRHSHAYQPTASDYAALGLGVPTAQNSTPAVESSLPPPAPPPAPPALAPTAPLVPAPAAAASPTPAPAAVRRNRSRVASQPSTDAPESPSKKKGKAGKAARADDGPAPREDALQAALDNTQNRLTDDEARIIALAAAAKTNDGRTAAEIANLKKQIIASNEALEALRAAGRKTRDDCERGLADVDAIIAQLKASRSGAMTDTYREEFEALDAEVVVLRSEHSQLLDQVLQLRARVEDHEDRIGDAVQHSRRALDAVTDLRESMARIERMLTYQRDAAGTATTSRRRRDSDAADDDPRAHKASRLADTRTARDAVPDQPRLDAADIPLSIQALHPRILSVRGGVAPHIQHIEIGRDDDRNTPLVRISSWTSLIDPTGGIPTPIAACKPPGMPVGFRLFTFASHDDLVRFLVAWEDRPATLHNITMTPVSENVVQPGPSGASIGLLPPGFRADNRPVAGRKGPRPF